MTLDKGGFQEVNLSWQVLYYL